MKKLIKLHRFNSILMNLLLVTVLLTGLAGARNAAADLLGVSVGFPLMTHLGGPGNVVYNAGTGLLSVDAKPQLIMAASGSSPVGIGDPRSLSIKIMLNGSGQVVGGNPGGTPDLRIEGTIPASSSVPGSPYSGVLLTGNIVNFGFTNWSGTTDKFDFRFTVTGGALTSGPLAAQYLGKDLGVTLVLEQSTFTGVAPNPLIANFSGLPKINVGSIPPLCIDLKKQISVDGVNFVDADTAADAPKLSAPAGAEYRLLVTNCGAVALRNLAVSDATLGLTDVPLSGTLDPGQTVTVSKGTAGFDALDQPGRCPQPGDYPNVAMVTGESTATNEKITDSDPALLVCTPPPCIELQKEVSVDGVNFFEAAAANAPSGAQYRLTVTNCSQQTALRNVTVEDETLFGQGVSIPIPGGSLNPGQSVVLTSATAGFGALDQPGRCPVPGTYPNTAQARGESVVDGKPVTASDTATLQCTVPPQAQCGLLVNIAATPAGPLARPASGCQNVTFTYTVTNLGDPASVDLVDESLVPITGVFSLARDESRNFQQTFCISDTLAKSAIANATVSGDQCSALNSATVTVVGEPAVELKKQISVDNGAHYFDADNENDPDVPVVTAPSGALYRFIVRNIGTTDLVNVAVNDAELMGQNVSYTVPTLARGQEVILGEGQIPEVSVTQRCGNAGTFINVADVSAVSAENSNDVVSDSDQAVLKCNALPQAVCNLVVGITANPQSFTLPQGASCQNVQFTYTVQNNGTAISGSLSDSLGLINTSLSLAEGELVSDTKTLCISATTSNIVTFSGTLAATGEECAAFNTVQVSVTPGSGGGTQGCTPGYWKQQQHFGSWTGYTTGQSFEAVFGVNISPSIAGDLTLLNALGLNGGGEKAMIRHAVAALLNASNLGVDYYAAVANVIAKVQAAYGTGSFEPTKDEFAAQNEKGCPLNRNPGDSSTVSGGGGQRQR